MADKIRVSDLDFVYISYKEPNKEENWADLLSKVPWAKRVDGVKGFDSANLHNCYSSTVINTDPRQAFIAGYREGVKMSLDKGERFKPEDFVRRVEPSNLKNLVTWMSVGADVENGKYAMIGARMGCYATTINTNHSSDSIRDVDKMAEIFASSVEDVDESLIAYAESLKQRIGVPIATYDSEESYFFKFCMPQHINRGVQDRETK